MAPPAATADRRPDSDRELLRAVLDEYPRSVRWFTELATVYWDRVWRLCQAALLDERAATEAAQETFLHAHRRLATFDFRQPFDRWLCAIARETADETRARRREGATRDSGAGGPGRFSRWFGRGSRKRAVPPAREVFSRLPPTDRRLLALSGSRGITEPELACAAEVPPERLARDLEAARAEFARLLGTEAAAAVPPPRAGEDGESGEDAVAAAVREAIGQPGRADRVGALDRLARQVLDESRASATFRSLSRAGLSLLDLLAWRTTPRPPEANDDPRDPGRGRGAGPGA